MRNELWDRSYEQGLRDGVRLGLRRGYGTGYADGYADAMLGVPPPEKYRDLIQENIRVKQHQPFLRPEFKDRLYTLPKDYLYTLPKGVSCTCGVICACER